MKTCGKCALRAPKSLICSIFHEPMKDTDPACAKYTTEIVECDLCHQSFLPSHAIIMPEGDKFYFLCPNCANEIGMCSTCGGAKHCSFETDPSPLPKIVQKQVKNGSMTMITQARNPAREAITCKKGCECYSDELGCLMECNTCGKWHMSIEAAHTPNS